jgi:peptidyl-prolyl cis-trans isomerase SurA
MKQTVFLLISLVLTFTGLAQKDGGKKDQGPVIFTYAGNPVYLEEFEHGYLKNKNLQTDTISAADIDEYLELYKKYKLKVHQAYEMQMDTIPAYKRELAGYRSQLAQSYLSDKTVTDELVKEAYMRMQTEVRASHILVQVSPDATPADSLVAFNKIKAIREDVMKEGASFGEIAFAKSEDPSAKMNKGDLGYFTALQMIYAFENQVYKSKIGEVSEVFRTSFGYHIIKVMDKRVAKGNIEVAHIMLKSSGVEATTEQKVNALYKELVEGGDFAALAKKHTDDQRSGVNGGVIGWISLHSNYPLEFKNQAFSLAKDGDFSKPFKTQYGWHIVKRISQKQLDPLNKMSNMLRAKINRDSRSEKSEEAVFNRIVKENHLKENEKVKKTAFASVDETLLKGSWIGDTLSKDKVLFSLDRESYTINQFLEYLYKTQQPVKSGDLNSVLERLYDEYLNKMVFNYEEKYLEQTNSEFRNTFREYKDGILLFNLAEKKIWKRASEDTTGLETFFNAHREDYMWKERINAVVFNASTQEILDRALKLAKEGIDYDSILKVVNKENQLDLVIHKGLFEQGNNQMVDSLFSRDGYKSYDSTFISLGKVEKDQIVTVLAIKYFPPMSKELKETRGPVTSDYQTVLEENWIVELKKAYKIEVDEEELEKFKTRMLNKI